MKLKILFADDDPNLLKIFQKWSELQGFAGDFAEDGEKAISLCRNKDYDVVILDIDMPVLDGISTAKELAKTNQNLKIFILTGLYPEREEPLPKNIVDVLQKPISLNELHKRIFNLLNK